jgi:MoaA/NifB/PqqE/SkfB family radical SAM enzyme
MTTNIGPRDILGFTYGGIRNYLTNRPLAMSLEVTLSCNCNCRHCNLGGVIKDEKQIAPDDYARLTQQLKPPVVQISGGEPLLREDIVEIVSAIKHGTGSPYLILVTNGALLSESLYLQLHNAGVNQLSVSLDFPDERHDDFRRHRGLYKHLSDTIPRLAKIGYRDIILNTAITKANFNELLPIAKTAMNWGVSVSYSAYTSLRTGDQSYSINDTAALKLLRKNIHELIELKKHSACITNSDTVLLDTVKFFEQDYLPGCKAGISFFVVTPDGSFVPCSLQRYKFHNQKEMINNYSCTNRCGACWVSIRSYTDRSFFSLIKDGPVYVKRLWALRKGYLSNKHYKST